MLIHPILRALRGDDAPQRDAQQAAHDALARWQARPEVAAVFADVAAFAHARPMAECPALASLFEEGEPSALDLARGFAEAGLAALAGAPLAHLPQRHFHDGAISTLLLARSGRVSLSLVAIDGGGLAARPAARAAGFWPGEYWEHVLAGFGEAEAVECRAAGTGEARLLRRDLRLQPGKVICGEAERQALVLRRVEGCLVSLKLQRRRAAAGPAREYDLETGRLLHCAAGDPRDSRTELMMAVLGRMGRADAAPLMAGIAGERGPEALRWQALRECLGLDTATGFRALTALAADAADPLRAPATALRAQLVTRYPQLGEIEPCPA